jgi:hypothetical protein
MQHGHNVDSPGHVLPRIRDENQLGKVRCHLGQQREEKLGLGPKSRAEMDPRE